MARRLHGLDCPVNAIPNISSSNARTRSDHTWDVGPRPATRFPNAISDWSGTPLTLRERRMIAFMGEVTDKPDWARKVRDEDIVSKWRAEALASNDQAKPELALTAKAFDYCMEELRDYATKMQNSQMVPAIAASGAVYKSDTRVTIEMKTALKAAAACLEEIDDSKKDWHPHSDKKVLDLVHPSLFPLLYGRSTAISEGTTSLADCDIYAGKGAEIPVPEDSHVQVKHLSNVIGWGGQPHHLYSKKFQWLPCEVAFRGDSNVEITSYINNLHPREHQPLYSAIESIIAKAVPMWDACLASSCLDHAVGEHLPPRDILDKARWGWNEPDQRRPRAENEEDLFEDDKWNLDYEWFLENRTLKIPDIANTYQSRAGHRIGLQPVDLRKQFPDEGLQIIVKLASIHLSPEKPDYEGGSWHIEGQRNEHICASALYYYDSSNIEDSFLSFREYFSWWKLQRAMDDDWDHLEPICGLKQGGPTLQELGRVNTREGRLLAFPNYLQHRVQPLSLADKAQPGHRKILALFLVDPHLRIPSTAHVPPQQKDWFRKMLLDLDRIADLPPELAEEIVNAAGPNLPIDLEEAKEIRLDLMKERKGFVLDIDKRFEEMDVISFCEH